LARRLKITPGAVSQHLSALADSVLADAGMVARSRVGRRPTGTRGQGDRTKFRGSEMITESGAAGKAGGGETVPDSSGRCMRGWLRVRPLMRGLLPVHRSQVMADVLAGVTLAAVSIPVALGYAKIAGMPVVTGLYTLLLPMAVFAILGSSRHLVVGADSATAAILGAALAGLAVAGSPQYVRLAGLAALLTGGLLLLARLARLGFLANFLSRSVLVGFLTGVGVQVAAGQLPDMLG